MRHWLLAALVAGFSFLMPMKIGAQSNHALGHGEYQNWSSRKVENCCNNRDCSALNKNQWRSSTETGTQVLIETTWCQVQEKHYVIRGKSPEWRYAHACIRSYTYDSDICERLLCFMGPGGV